MFDWLRKRLPPGADRCQATGAEEAVTSVATAPHYSVDTLASGESNARMSLINLGGEAAATGEFAEAAYYYRQALSMDPGDAKLRVVLSSVLIGQQLYAEAKTHLNRAILLDPRIANGFYLLGKIAHEERDLQGAIESYSEALEIEPDLEIVFKDLASAFLLTGRADLAEATLEQGIAACPQSAKLYSDLGTHYANVNQPEKAVKSYQKAVMMRPKFYEAHNNLGVVLLQQGQAAAGISGFRRAMSFNPDYLDAHSNLLWALSFQMEGLGDRYLHAARSYGEKVLARARLPQEWVGDSGPGRTRFSLRVGLISGDFRNHPVGIFLEGVLRISNPAKLELMAYSMNPQDDSLTERIKRRFVQWTPIEKMSDEDVARKIHEDGIDILIDLAGHSAHNRLPVFAWKPAPVQVSWLGYMASTGVPGIDYVLADPVSVPEECRDQFTEEVWHLPETLFCFTPPGESLKLAVVAPPALGNGYITFGSFQRLNKLSDVTLALWGRIFKALPEARLCLRNQEMNSQEACDRLRAQLGCFGVTPERVTIAGKIQDREDYLASYAGIDMVLDTFPHPGVTTTCEALWMGVPTVTLAGTTMLSRIGASLLTCAGLKELVASSQDEYVELALKLAKDVERLAQLRLELREQVAATPLFDAKRFVPHLEDALFAIWRHKMAADDAVTPS